MPETHTHKRKRNLPEGIPADMYEKMMDSLNALREELSGIDKTEEEMAEVMKNVDEFDRFLKEKIVVRSKFTLL